MDVKIKRLSENSFENRDGVKCVMATFFWDGVDRRVAVPLGKVKVGDHVIVRLYEWYNSEKKTGGKTWLYEES